MRHYPITGTQSSSLLTATYIREPIYGGWSSEKGLFLEGHPP